MTWLDSDGKFNILCWVSILEIIMFRMKPPYSKTKYNLLLLLYIQLLLDLLQSFQNRYLLQLFCFCILKYFFLF